MALLLAASGCSPSSGSVAGDIAPAARASTVDTVPALATSDVGVRVPVSADATLGPPVPADSLADAHPSAHLGGGVPPGILQGNLGVRDQQGDGRSVSLSAEIDGSPGWVVIARDDQGRPGTVLGSVRRGNGVHDDVVMVVLKRRLSGTASLWATLVVDQGRPGVLEYPGVDSPLQFQGRDLSRPFTYTVG